MPTRYEGTVEEQRALKKNSIHNTCRRKIVYRQQWHQQQQQQNHAVRYTCLEKMTTTIIKN